MRRLLILAVAAMGVLALPGTASAAYNGNDCSTGYLPGDPNVGVHAGTGGMPGTVAAAGACVNVPNASGFEGGSVEAGVGEDAATGAADPEVVSGVGPDAYAVVDGDNGNTVHPQADGYAGVSNWETGSTRASGCGTGFDDGSAGSSNSGGCLNNVLLPPAGPVPAGSVPTPVCGNTSGNSWNGQGQTEGVGNRDGCEVPN